MLRNISWRRGPVTCVLCLNLNEPRLSTCGTVISNELVNNVQHCSLQWQRGGESDELQGLRIRMLYSW